jgi:hypothetical protein
MAVQRVVIKEWSVSSNDAGAFYGASDPLIQAWTPGMYDAITALARARFQVAAPTSAQVNEMFWRVTFWNYKAHLKYHLGRIVPYLWLTACLPLPLAPAGTDWWQNVLLTALAGGLCLGLLRQRQWWRTGILCLAAGFLWLSPQTVGFMTIAGLVLALLSRPAGPRSLAIFLVACYWLSGAAALYLTGGMSGPPLYGGWFANSLGDRLGFQVVFSSGLLASYFLLQLASLHLPVVPLTGTGLADRFLSAPTPVARRLLRGSLATVAALVLVIYAAGTTRLVQRVAALNAAPRVDFPDLAPVAEHYRKKSQPIHGRPLVVVQDLLNFNGYLSIKKGSGDLGDILVHGQVGPLLWNLPHQERALLRLHVQQHASPAIREETSVFVQVPAHLPLGEWAGRRGAFVLRSIPDTQDNFFRPEYLNTPVVRAFVPLSEAEDGRGYDLDRAVWFPLDLYASQLHAIKILRCVRGKLDLTTTVQPGQGRILTVLPRAADDNRAALKLDLTRLVGRKSLSFAYQQPAVWGSRSLTTSAELRLRVTGVRRGTGERVLLCSFQDTVPLPAPRTVALDPSQLDGLDGLELAWEGGTTAPVWVYELVARAEELVNP